MRRKHDAEPVEPTYVDRLRDGFAMLCDDEEFVDESEEQIKGDPRYDPYRLAKHRPIE